MSLDLQGWNEEAASNGSRFWHDRDGDLLSLTMPGGSLDLTELTDQAALQTWARTLAEHRGGGLIEARLVHGALGSAASLVYKRLNLPAYIFTGMLIIPRREATQVWTLVATEHGTTGVREATITAELMSAGKLTMREYERSWARDPYDSSYHGVDKSVLRFVSDDERYDERFPDHPLSKARKVLAEIPSSVRAEPLPSGL